MIAAPRKQINHKYIDRSVSEWLDLHFGDQSFNGRIFIGHRKRGGGIYTMAARSLSDLRQYVLLVHASQRLDYYITANTVSGVSRTIDGLFGLQNIVVDIDCHDDSYTIREIDELIQNFLWRAQRDLWNTKDLPEPNSIVRTGRGVQLWWAIKPCHASCRFHYDQIKVGLMDHLDGLLSEYSELDGLQIDRAASSNPVGYFRMPRTFNTAAGRYGTLQVLHSERYDTHDLAGYISPLPEKRRAPEPSEDIPMQKGDLVVLHNAYSTGANRVLQLIKLRNLRDNEVGEETRNNLCFSVYNALRMARFDHDEAMERLRAYNEGFKQPMTEKELEHTVCTAKRRGGYKYTNTKLIELLGITQEEQDAIGLHPFTGVFKPWSHSKPNAVRDAIRKARRDGRDAQIVAMHQEGTSQAEIARALKISRNTVAKILKEWRTDIEAADLAKAQDDLLNNGNINDCIIARQEVAVSAEDGQPSPSDKGVFVLPNFMNTGPPFNNS